MYVFHIDSVDIDSIECIRGPCLVVLTVSHSIQCIACFDVCIDSVDKQDILLNTQ